jgi:hypothetical protein
LDRQPKSLQHARRQGQQMGSTTSTTHALRWNDTIQGLDCLNKFALEKDFTELHKQWTLYNSKFFKETS